MMKIKVLSILTGTVIFLSNLAIAENTTNLVNSSASIFSNTFIENEINVAYGPKTCYAWASCRGGYTVSCMAYGSGCSFKSYKYQGVQCTGNNEYGMWTSWTVSC